MKKIALLFAMTADAANQVGTVTSPAFGTPEADSEKIVLPAVVQPEPASELLTKLRNDYSVAFDAMKLLTDINEQQKSMLVTFKIQKEIEGEITNIKTLARDAEAQMKRNERIKLVDTLLAAHVAKLMVDSDKKSTEEARNVANDAFNAAKDVVQNELLARYGTSKPSTSVATGTTSTGERGAKGAEILAEHQANLAGGKTVPESKAAIVASGHAVGTVGAVILKWEREQGLK